MKKGEEEEKRKENRREGMNEKKKINILIEYK